MTLKRTDAGRWLLAGAVCLIVADAGASARAQSPEDMPVKERTRPEYDPVGIRQGNVFFYPSIGLSEKYNDNVFATDGNTSGDLITVVSPALAVRSDGTRGRWRAGISANIGRYADNSDEDYEDASATAGGDYDVAPDARFSLDTSFSRQHEERGSPDDAGGTDPTVYYRSTGRLAYSQTFNRLSARFELGARDYKYEDVTNASGGSIDNSDRDRKEYEQSLRVGYEISPGYSLFTRGSLSQRRYDNGADNAGVNRDSDGYRVEAGVSVEATRLLSFEASLGYLSRDYDDLRLESVSGPAASLSATWMATRLTTVTASVEREVEETTISGASGRFDTGTRLEVDHELRRNIILSGQLGYRNSEFEGASRTDDIFDAGVSMDYLVAQGAKLSASATHVERQSDAAGADYSQNVVSLRVRYGF